MLNLASESCWHLFLDELSQLLLGDLAGLDRLGDVLRRLDPGDRDGEDFHALLLAVLFQGY